MSLIGLLAGLALGTDVPLPPYREVQSTLIFDKPTGSFTGNSGDPSPTLVQGHRLLVTWNPSHTEASLRIWTNYGSMNGTGTRIVVRKFGNDWVVVSLQTEVAC